MDYTAVFKAETDKLIELNLLPATELSEADNLRIINEIKARQDMMELAIKELRVRIHAGGEAINQHTAQLPKHKQKELADLDMKDRQKKQAEKLDKAVAVKKAQAAAMTLTLQKAKLSPEVIRAALLKAGLV